MPARCACRDREAGRETARRSQSASGPAAPWLPPPVSFSARGKVTFPAKEIRNPQSIARLACSHSPVKQCRMPPSVVRTQLASIIASVSSHALVLPSEGRQWMMIGRRLRRRQSPFAAQRLASVAPGASGHNNNPDRSPRRRVRPGSASKPSSFSSAAWSASWASWGWIPAVARMRGYRRLAGIASAQLQRLLHRIRAVSDANGQNGAHPLLPRPLQQLIPIGVIPRAVKMCV